MRDKLKLFCNSQSSIHLAKNPSYYSKTKHIPIKCHFVRHVIDDDGLGLEKFHSKENRAYMFTKPVLIKKLRWCLSSLGLQER